MATPNKTRKWNPQEIVDALNSSTSSFEAARKLKVSEFTLWRYMRQVGIVRVCRYEMTETDPQPTQEKSA